MANWKDELWRSCKKALTQGGEVRIIFNKRDKNKRIPTIQVYIDNYIRCDEEVILPDD